ncbi:MAG: endonuclease III [Planctomycetes bacterium]|nr:endonuclease III [Planctomycetota bacterium]
MATRRTPPAGSPGATPKAAGAQAAAIADALLREYGDARCALLHRTPFELLVATILSAQCTDERVNQVTPTLFAAMPTPQAVVESRPGDLEAIIRSTGFFNAKAKNIRGACALLVERFGGRVPRTMEELLMLPGVARKTANVVLGTGFGIRSGFVVDTHIHRLSRRLGLTEHDDPEKVEQDLCRLLPDHDWIQLGHSLISHGRRICTARAPDCERCPIASLCISRGLAPDAWKRKDTKRGASRAARTRPASIASKPRHARGRMAQGPGPSDTRDGQSRSGSSRRRRG